MSDEAWWEPDDGQIHAYFAYHTPKPVYMTYMEALREQRIKEQILIAQGLMSTSDASTLSGAGMTLTSSIPAANRVDKTLIKHFSDVEPRVNHIGVRNYRLLDITDTRYTQEQKDALLALNPSISELASVLMREIQIDSHINRPRTNLDSHGRAVRLREPRKFRCILLASHLPSFGHKLIKRYNRIYIEGFNYFICEIQGERSRYVTLIAVDNLLDYDWIVEREITEVAEEDIQTATWPPRFLNASSDTESKYDILGMSKLTTGALPLTASIPTYIYKSGDVPSSDMLLTMIHTTPATSTSSTSSTSLSSSTSSTSSSSSSSPFIDLTMSTTYPTRPKLPTLPTLPILPAYSSIETSGIGLDINSVDTSE
jgi:hypothetical protein